MVVFFGHVKIDLCQMLVDAGDHLQGLETWCCILVGCVVTVMI